jgi:hypothetical protein
MTSRLGRQAGDGAARLPEEDRPGRCRCSAAGLLDASKARAAPSTLRWSSAQNPGTLDTLTNQFDYAFPPFNTVYEGLTRYPPATNGRPSTHWRRASSRRPTARP